MRRKGTIYVVATPIGNIQDISERALATLREIKIIACENTRRTATLLERVGAEAGDKTWISLNAFNENDRTNSILERLRNGSDIALVSDAGTPLLCDPGYPLIHSAFAEGMAVIPIPGPSALSATLAVCPIPLAEFLFVGFLAKKHGDKLRQLRQLIAEEKPVVFFETPRRILDTLQKLVDLGGRDRAVFVARELTKVNEELLYDTIERVLSRLNEREQLRGEFVVVLGRNEEAQFYELDRLLEIFAYEDISPSQIARILAKITQVPRSEIYKRLVGESHKHN